MLAAFLFIGVNYFFPLLPRTPIRNLRDLPPSSAVHLIGVVTYTDKPTNRFWLEDETGTTLIPLDPAGAGAVTGQTIAVDARLMGRYDPAEGSPSLNLENIRLRPSSVRVKLPSPSAVLITSFPSEEQNGSRVRVDGVVEDEYADASGRAWLTLTAGGGSVDVAIDHPSGDYTRLLDARVRIVGIAELVPEGPSKRIWVPDTSGVQLLEPPPGTSPLDSIRDLYREDISAFGHRIRVRGRIAAVYSSSILLEDQSGAIEVRIFNPSPLRRC